MSIIVPVQFKPQINESLVEMLEQLLERAQKGDLVSGKFCGTTAAGEISTGLSSTNNSILELAAVARLMHRVQINMDLNAE